MDEGLDLLAVAHDAGVEDQLLDFGLGEACDLVPIEAGEDAPIVLTLAKYGDPAQSSLGSFEVEHLKELGLIPAGDAPFGVVIVLVQLVAEAPWAAWIHRGTKVTPGAPPGHGATLTYGPWLKKIVVPSCQMTKSQAPRRTLLATAAFMALFVAGCSTPFGYSLKLRSGWDPPRADSSSLADNPGDRIYMVAERIEGVGSGLCALEIPADWKGRATHPVQPGFAALDRPIEARWIYRKEEMPEALPGPFNGWANSPGWHGEPELVVLQQAPSSQQGRVFESPSVFAYDDIRIRLESGGDAYVVVPRDRFLKYGFDGFDVYGATGPPIVWVHLGTVNVRSGESSFAFGLARSVGALAYGLDVITAVAGGVVIGIVTLPVGGAAVFFTLLNEPFEAPW